MHTAMYSAPAGSGLLYWTHSPALTMIACPAATSNAVHDARHLRNLTLGLVILAVAVPVEGVLDLLVQPRLFQDVDFAAVTCVVTDLADTRTCDPKRRPVAGLTLELHTGHVVAKAVFQLALGRDAAAIFAPPSAPWQVLAATNVIAHDVHLAIIRTSVSGQPPFSSEANMPLPPILAQIHGLEPSVESVFGFWRPRSSSCSCAGLCYDGDAHRRPNCWYLGFCLLSYRSDTGP